MKNFTYLQPTTVAEAVSLLQGYGEQAKVLAGGQSLIILLRQGLAQPDYLIDLRGIAALRGITGNGEGGIHIGALTTLREVERSPLLLTHCAPLVQAVQQTASVPVRNLGTLGGNLCHAELGGDPPSALVALGATVKVVGTAGERTLAVEQLIVDYFATGLAPDEILTEIHLPPQPQRCTGVYLKYCVRAVDPALVGVAAVIERTPNDGACRQVRLALGGVAPRPLLAQRAMALAQGQHLEEGLIAEMAEVAAADTDPLSDAHASADYRRKMAKVFVRRALRQAWAQALQSSGGAPGPGAP